MCKTFHDPASRQVQIEYFIPVIQGEIILLFHADKFNKTTFSNLVAPQVTFYDTLESFYLAEALEYLEAWRHATPSRPAGICGPIGPTEQLPLVAQLVNAFKPDLKHAHFWGMDEWVVQGKETPASHPLSFERADRDLCFSRFNTPIPEENLHFPKSDSLEEYSASFSKFRCAIMQGGQGDVKHWAFNDPEKYVRRYAFTYV